MEHDGTYQYNMKLYESIWNYTNQQIKVKRPCEIPESSHTLWEYVLHDILLEALMPTWLTEITIPKGPHKFGYAMLLQ